MTTWSSLLWFYILNILRPTLRNSRRFLSPRVISPWLWNYVVRPHQRLAERQFGFRQGTLISVYMCSLPFFTSRKTNIILTDKCRVTLYFLPVQAVFTAQSSWSQPASSAISRHAHIYVLDLSNSWTPMHVAMKSLFMTPFCRQVWLVENDVILSRDQGSHVIDKGCHYAVLVWANDILHWQVT